MSKNNKHILVLVTSKSCHYCKKFKPGIWKSLQNKFEKYPNLKVVEIELETNNSQPSQIEYHPDLNKFIGWFPTLMLFPQNLWKNYKTTLQGKVFNGEFVFDKKLNKDVIAYVSRNENFTELSILTWYNTIIKKDPLFNNNNNNNNNNNKYSLIKNISSNQINTFPLIKKSESNKNAKSLIRKDSKIVKYNDNLSILITNGDKILASSKHSNFNNSIHNNKFQNNLQFKPCQIHKTIYN